MTRPRAADDFAVIRARMEQLRREAEPVPTGSQTRTLPPRPYQHSKREGTGLFFAESATSDAPETP
jgi:hypothetical protein